MAGLFSDKNAQKIIFLFVGFALLFFILQVAFPNSPVDFAVLKWGNILLFILGLISVRMSTRAMEHQHVQVFFRLVYGSFLMKFFVLAIVAFVYIITFKKNVNKPALFGCFGLYFIYMIVEVWTVIKKRKKTDA